MTLRLLAGAALLLIAAGCSSVHRQYEVPTNTLIAQHTRPGGQTSYSLVQRRSDQATLHRSIDSTREVAYLGLVIANVDGDLARALGVVAWNGVYIESVVADSPAANAGIIAGDILRSIDGEDIGSRDEAREFIDGQLVPGAQVEILVQRWKAQGDDIILAGQRLAVTTGSRDVEQTVKESFPLRLSDGVQQLTGLAVAEVQADLAREIWGASQAVLTVAGVITGSPAYHAGFRTGDRIVAVNGEPPSSLADLERPVASRALALGVELSALRVDGTSSWIGEALQPGDDDPRLDVSGPLGPHSAQLTIDPDLDDDSEIYIPILLDWEGDARSTNWAFLDFIFQFGATYHGNYRRSTTRKSARSTYFSMLPFGMFEFESTARGREYTLLWFITIG